MAAHATLLDHRVKADDMDGAGMALDVETYEQLGITVAAVDELLEFVRTKRSAKLSAPAAVAGPTGAGPHAGSEVHLGVAGSPLPPPRHPRPMDARSLLQRMCERHDLPFGEASRLVPLIERALNSPHHVRDRILVLVENNLARKATGNPAATTEEVHRDLDEEVLTSVARVLHNWTPSSRILDLGQVMPDIFPEGFNPEDLETDA